MSKKPFVPDAWDDDWETIADKQGPAVSATQQTQPSKKISKAERRAQQAELNRQLWQEAEAPKNFHFLESRAPVPFKSEFKPTMTVLSREPNQPKPGSPARQGQTVSNTTAGIENVSLKADDDDSDDEALAKPIMTPEERRLQTIREREQKQKKYDEARGRLFGTPDAGSGASSPGNVTPPHDQPASKGKGKGKATTTGDQDRTRPTSVGKGKQLYDPNYTPKPDSAYVQKRGKEDKSREDKKAEDQKGSEEIEEDGMNHPIRQPRGPDGTRGFVKRGGHATR